MHNSSVLNLEILVMSGLNSNTYHNGYRLRFFLEFVQFFLFFIDCSRLVLKKNNDRKILVVK